MSLSKSILSIRVAFLCLDFERIELLERLACEADMMDELLSRFGYCRLCVLSVLLALPLLEPELEPGFDFCLKMVSLVAV